MDPDKENDPDNDKRKNINVYSCVAYSRYLFTSTHKVIDIRNRFKYILDKSMNVLPYIY